MSPLSFNNNVVPLEWLSDHLESYQGAETIQSDMSIEFSWTINQRIMPLRMYIITGRNLSQARFYNNSTRGESQASADQKDWIRSITDTFYCSKKSCIHKISSCIHRCGAEYTPPRTQCCTSPRRSAWPRSPWCSHTPAWWRGRTFCLWHLSSSPRPHTWW